MSHVKLLINRSSRLINVRPTDILKTVDCTTIFMGKNAVLTCCIFIASHFKILHLRNQFNYKGSLVKICRFLWELLLLLALQNKHDQTVVSKAKKFWKCNSRYNIKIKPIFFCYINCSNFLNKSFTFNVCRFWNNLPIDMRTSDKGGRFGARVKELLPQ